ncbi:MAG: glycosyltransferase family 2 protein [Dysgonamonadaceae bacterium]|jgi:glycosyltransferase involved in cell wall biosynthesis|nr:glycosyltransferase family 2 protein [Dysgonamonadaceae bacterium]
MKVSIVMPVHNVEKYIIRSLDSIMAQTYPDIECILVDDCGQDDSMPLAEQRIKDYAGPVTFKLLHHEQNRGPSAARNTGTVAATGDYVYYMDSDDEIVPRCVEHLMLLAGKYPGVEMVQGNTYVVTEEKNYNMSFCNISDRGFPEYVDSNDWVRAHFYGMEGGCIPQDVANKLVKKKFITDNQLFFDDRLYVFENDYWMFFAVKKLSSIAFTTDVTYLYYKNDNAATTSGDYEARSIKAVAILTETVLNNLDQPLMRQQKRKYLFQLYGFYRRNLLIDRQDYYPVYRKMAVTNACKEIRRGHLQYLFHWLIVSITPPVTNRVRHQVFRFVYLPFRLIPNLLF